MIIRFAQFTLLMLLSSFVISEVIPANSSPPNNLQYIYTNCTSASSGNDTYFRNQCTTSHGTQAYFIWNYSVCSGDSARPMCGSCPAGMSQPGDEGACYSCPEGYWPVEGDPSQCTDQDPDPCPEEGTLAGIDEGADSPPGYATKCYGECSVIGYEYFQRTDNDLWVISYIYTGTKCGDGDPVAEPTLPPGETPPDPITPTTDKDTSGDGVPDHASDDIDGDGVPNSQDPDIDGDGIPNEDDPTPWGRPASEEPSRATTSQNCSQHPSCSGDAIQCAQLVEIWRLRCKTPLANTQEISESLDDDIIAGSVNSGEQALQNASDEIIGALDDESGISLSTDLQNPITALFNGVTCTDIGFEFEGNSFNISCTETQLMRDVMAFILYVTTIVYLYQLARKPVEN